MKKLPKHCQGQSMGFFDMIKAKLGRFVELPSNECREYHIAMQSSPHLQITPIQVMSFCLSKSMLITFCVIQGYIDDFRTIIYNATWNNR